MEQKPVSRQRMRMRREEAVMRDVRDLYGKVYESLEVRRVKGPAGGLFIEWTFTVQQWAEILVVAAEHGESGDKFLDRIAQIAMARHPRTSRN